MYLFPFVYFKGERFWFKGSFKTSESKSKYKWLSFQEDANLQGSLVLVQEKHEFIGNEFQIRGWCWCMIIYALFLLFEFDYIFVMRSTLPLSSFPLHLILYTEHYYTLLLSAFTFLLVLFKTYNLPYTSGMGAQEGIILLIFVLFTRIRVQYGIGANQVIIF